MSAVPEAVEEGEEGLSEDAFAKQLQAGMADLLGELESSVSRHHTVHVELVHFTHSLIA